VFLDSSRFEEYTVTPISNGLSDHVAQLLTLSIKVFNLPTSKSKSKSSNESWDTVFNSDNVNDMFNSFLNNYLRIFHSSFPPHRIIIKKNTTNNNWITKGIKISCKNKRELCLAYRQNNNEEIKSHYRLYSKILSNVIKEAKKCTIIIKY
jgi:hypothetical protein